MQIVFVPCRGGKSEVGIISDSCIKTVDFLEKYVII